MYTQHNLLQPVQELLDLRGQSIALNKQQQERKLIHNQTLARIGELAEKPLDGPTLWFSSLDLLAVDDQIRGLITQEEFDTNQQIDELNDAAVELCANNLEAIQKYAVAMAALDNQKLVI